MRATGLSPGPGFYVAVLVFNNFELYYVFA